MFEFNNLVTGYEPAVLALVLVLAYFVVVALMLSPPKPQRTAVPRYEPPTGASPGIAAWLFEGGRLPRAMAAALVDMAAKGWVKIEQSEDLFTVTQLQTEIPGPLQPEEDALARTLFEGYDCFSFDEVTPQLTGAVRAFHWALIDTTYFSENVALSVPAWIVSGLAMLFALTHRTAHFKRDDGGYLVAIALVTFGCFVVAVRTLPGALENLASRLPSSTAPQRPWTGADTRPFTFLLVTLGGVALLAVLTTTVAALLTGGFLLINAVFFHVFQGPTRGGRKIMAQLAEYRNFLAEVDADAISRGNPSGRPPAQFHPKDAYALAFHLDLGWGEQFVTSIADLIECVEILPAHWGNGA